MATTQNKSFKDNFFRLLQTTFGIIQELVELKSNLEEVQEVVKGKFKTLIKQTIILQI